MRSRPPAQQLRWLQVVPEPATGAPKPCNNAGYSLQLLATGLTAPCRGDNYLLPSEDGSRTPLMGRAPPGAGF